jgi:hypothetical protein
MAEFTLVAAPHVPLEVDNNKVLAGRTSLWLRESKPTGSAGHIRDIFVITGIILIVDVLRWLFGCGLLLRCCLLLLVVGCLQLLAIFRCCMAT